MANPLNSAMVSAAGGALASAALMVRPPVSSGSANDITLPGPCLVLVGVTDLPSGYTSGALKVTPLGDGFFEQIFNSVTSSQIQTQFQRTIRPTTGSYPGWVRMNMMTRSNLSASFAYNGTVTTGSFNDYFAEGPYIVGAALTDGPSGAPTTGLLKCTSFGGTFVIQEYVSSTLSAVLTVWKRSIRPGESYGAWVKDVPVSHGAASRWSGKNVAFVGDSIFRMVSSPWVASVAADLGLANGYQGGVAGCTMGRRQFSGDALNDYLRELGATKLVDAMVSGNWTGPIAAATYCRDNGGDTQLVPAVTVLSTVSYSTLDALLIGFGTNDFGCSLPIGSDADTDWTTFKGAINYVVSTFQTAYPSCRLMFTAPLWRARNAAGDGNDADLVPNSGGIYLREYADAVIDRAQAHKIPVLDNYRESGINKYNASTMFSDGLHPWTVPGNQRMTDKITAFMERSY